MNSCNKEGKLSKDRNPKRNHETSVSPFGVSSYSFRTVPDAKISPRYWGGRCALRSPVLCFLFPLGLQQKELPKKNKWATHMLNTRCFSFYTPKAFHSSSSKASSARIDLVAFALCLPAPATCLAAVSQVEVHRSQGHQGKKLLELLWSTCSSKTQPASPTAGNHQEKEGHSHQEHSSQAGGLDHGTFQEEQRKPKKRWKSVGLLTPGSSLNVHSTSSSSGKVSKDLLYVKKCTSGDRKNHRHPLKTKNP